MQLVFEVSSFQAYPTRFLPQVSWSTIYIFLGITVTSFLGYSLRVSWSFPGAAVFTKRLRGSSQRLWEIVLKASGDACQKVPKDGVPEQIFKVSHIRFLVYLLPIVRVVWAGFWVVPATGLGGWVGWVSAGGSSFPKRVSTIGLKNISNKKTERVSSSEHSRICRERISLLDIRRS